MRIAISEGEIIPRGYGIAYREWNSMRAICYPFPLNWIVGSVRSVWLTVRNVRMDEFSDEIRYLREENWELKRKIKVVELERNKAQGIINDAMTKIMDEVKPPSSGSVATCDSCHEAISWCDCPEHTTYSLKQH